MQDEKEINMQRLVLHSFTHGFHSNNVGSIMEEMDIDQVKYAAKDQVDS